MLENIETLPLVEEETTFKARDTLARRLADIVCLPTSRISPQERHITGDLLLELLREADLTLRTRCAQRISVLSEAPSIVVRFLARDDITVAASILEDSDAISDSDLVATARQASVEHRRLIARRRSVSELVADAVAEFEEPLVIEALLQNKGAALSQTAVECIVAASRDHPSYCSMVVGRPELRPSLGLTMFWWADAGTRRVILRRFGVERHMLQDASSDVFGMAAEEGWSDAVTRKALQFIERRQRNRAAIEKSPYASLEDAVVEAGRVGLDQELSDEISYLAGVRPATGVQILNDFGGEPVAILCKATGLKRDALATLWGGMVVKGLSEDAAELGWERALEAYDTSSTDKAQTVLRYWNWSLTSALSPALAKAASDTGASTDEFSTASRSARLVFGRAS